jgi:SAM-dependent methyltransferase
MLADLKARGADVIGVDADAAMVEAARVRCPGVDIRLGDARDLDGVGTVDAILSNATLHWVRPPEAAARAMAKVLAPGGRLVLEMGGAGCVRTVAEALTRALEAAGVSTEGRALPWYFPSLGAYAALLEAHGFDVRQAWLFDRPTPLDDGDRGLESWLEMFVPHLLDHAPREARSDVVRAVEDACRPRLFRHGRWELDYVRLRLTARH